jgi:nitric oxide reductase subunit B
MNRSKQAGMTKKTAVALLVGLVFGSGCAASGFSRVRGQVLQSDMQTLRWLRMPGDTLFAIGAIAFVVFVFGLGLGYSLKDKGRSPAGLRTGRV